MIRVPTSYTFCRMQIKMHNVEYGEYIDCFIDDRRALTVDCGSVNSKIAKAMSHTLNYEIPVMISHLHSDHYNGFLEYVRLTKQKFKKMYLPYISSNTQNVLLESALYDLYINGSLSSYNKINSLKHMLEMCDISNIVFLERGKTIPEIPNSIVLWPCADDTWFNEHLSTLFHLTHTIRKKLFFENPKIVEMLDADSLILSNIYDEIISDNKEIGHKEIEGYINSINKIILKYKQYQKENDNNQNSTISNLLLNVENACSIVFSNNDYFGEYLFTGDITKRVQEYLFYVPALNKDYATRYNRKYKFIKLPHHATKDYFDITIIPSSLKYGISNGHSPHSTWKISSDITCILNEVYCTNGCNSGCYCSRPSAKTPNHCYCNHTCWKGDVDIVI